jgi:hypothetical protein
VKKPRNPENSSPGIWFDRHHVTWENKRKTPNERSYFGGAHGRFREDDSHFSDYVLKTRQKRNQESTIRRPWSEGRVHCFPEPIDRELCNVGGNVRAHGGIGPNGDSKLFLNGNICRG